jgi:hypothetical protein
MTSTTSQDGSPTMRSMTRPMSARTASGRPVMALVATGSIRAASSRPTTPAFTPPSGLRTAGAVHDDAVARLHALLLRAARFEIGRRRDALSHVRGEDLERYRIQHVPRNHISVERIADEA